MPHFAYPGSVLMIFCKAPVPGLVKTRLVPPLTPVQAASLHVKLSIRIIDLALASHLCPVQLWCAPTTEHPFFHSLSESRSLTLMQQHGNDLGERMHHAFCLALNQFSSALLIGSDCPSLARTDINEALASLGNSCNAVIAPAEDGGYVLIGLKRPCLDLFTDLPWGTSEIYARTLQKFDRNKLHYRLLKRQWDLDTPDDLRRYRTTGIP